MSFALLADSTSEDPRELLKKANAKQTTKPEVVAEAPSQNQNKPKSAGKKDDKVSRGPRKPRSDEGAVQSGDAIEGGRPQRGGRGGRGGRHHGYIPPKRGFEHDRSVSRTGRGREVQKGGHGKFNYGKEGEEVNAEQQPQTEAPKEENQEGAQEKPKVEEEKDDTISFEEFTKQRAEKKKNIESLVQKAKPREGENIKYDNAIAKFVEKPVEKKEAAPAPVEKKVEKQTGPVTININEFLKDAPVKQRRDNREFRGGRGGRGRGGRGGRGGHRPKSAPAPEFNPKDFPTLK